MKSRGKQLPDYEFMLWNFDRFDINKSLWVKEFLGWPPHSSFPFLINYDRLADYNS
jgi:hypothetical protein